MQPIVFSEQEAQFIAQASHVYVQQQGLTGNAAGLGICILAKIQAASGVTNIESAKVETDGDGGA